MSADVPEQNVPGKTLLEQREAIDAIDQQVLRLMSERATHAQTIGHLKQGGPIYRPEREAQVLRNVISANPGPIPND